MQERTYPHVNRPTHKLLQTYAYTCVHAYTMYTHAQPYKQAYTCTSHTYTCKCACIHTNTHTHSLFSLIVEFSCIVIFRSKLAVGCHLISAGSRNLSSLL